MMNVKGFDPSKKCLPCLIGDRIDIGKGADAPEDLELSGVDLGDVVYLCGVSRSFELEKNFHLVAKYTGIFSESVVQEGFFGGTVILRGFRKVHFDDKAARRLYPEKPESFLSCRNFQFGADFFGLVPVQEVQVSS